MSDSTKPTPNLDHRLLRDWCEKMFGIKTETDFVLYLEDLGMADDLDVLIKAVKHATMHVLDGHQKALNYMEYFYQEKHRVLQPYDLLVYGRLARELGPYQQKQLQTVVNTLDPIESVTTERFQPS